jgi:hypothetical protein
MRKASTGLSFFKTGSGAKPSCSIVTLRFSVDGGSLSFISIGFRLSAIYFSTVSPSPLTAEAQSLSPETSQPYGSRKLEVTSKYISF